MRAFVVSKYKEPLQEADVPEPVVGEHDVLVPVQAAGLNVVDEKIRAGRSSRSSGTSCRRSWAATSPER